LYSPRFDQRIDNLNSDVEMKTLKGAIISTASEELRKEDAKEGLRKICNMTMVILSPTKRMFL
jgi:hypothetical protein